MRMVLVLILSWLAALAGPARAAERPVQYDHDVLPILADNCYKCHGPDEKSRKAHLRLDQKESAFRVEDGAAIIAPGKSARSELVRRITAKDPDDLMPPPESGRKLTQGQINTLIRWIDEGAKWDRHWSLVAPVKHEPPAVKDENWPRNAIDRFVLARLEKEQLHPSPPTKRETLLRRVTLDLTGLPPTPAEVAAFVNDKSPDAYEKVVDRLLASPRYGERMATIWLDLARYADTNGYQMDRYRPMWPYRDWVIKAFNENLRYDRFVTWQVAGDLLPNATKEQKLATAFNRLHMQNEEGGIIEEEYRCAYVVDRVDTFGTAFLGLTFECSRCHDHKFDPITQKDFYSLFAMFQNIDESGQTSYFTNAMPVPTLILSSDAQDKKLAEIRGRITKVEGELAAARVEAGKSVPAKVPATQPAGEVGHFAFEKMEGNKVANLADASKPGHGSDGPKLVEGKMGKAALLSGENGFTFPGIGHFNRTDTFTLAINVKCPVHEPRMVVVHHSKAPIDAGSRGYELLLEDGRVAFGLHHMWPGNSLKVVTKEAIPVNRWTHIAATYDGSSRAAGVHLYINGREAAVEVVRDGLYKDITYTVDSSGEPDLAIGFRFRDNGFKNGEVDEFRVFKRALTGLEIQRMAGIDAEPTKEQALDYYFATSYEPAKKLMGELHELRKEENDLVNPIPEIMVMKEMSHPKPAYILKRGAYDAHGAEVSANTPAFLPAMGAGEPKNRLGLAHWLFAADNPLTARVAVNRLWQQMFGDGIVKTADNFGTQGSPPTHQELLDYLACEYRDSGWDTKHMLKMIAMSATYQQSSAIERTGSTESDPDNALLSRGPARRLSAEMLRDQALFDSGLLVEKLGGPSVKPYQPPGVWDVAMGGPHYDQGHGDALHRRSLYTYWKRSVAPPAMLAFDAPDHNYCVAKRQSTATPLQALVLLNDVQITEASRLIAQRMIKEGGKTVDERVAWVFELIADRPANEKELPILKEIFTEQRAMFAADPAAAKKLLSVGEAKNEAGLDPLDLAAGTVLAEAILNHDEAIMRR